VAVLGPAGADWASATTLDADIPAPGPGPAPHATLRCDEHVGPETDYSTIVEGNSTLSGAAITPHVGANPLGIPEGHVNIRITVRGHPGTPAACGQFKAVYRVYWVPFGEDPVSPTRDDARSTYITERPDLRTGRDS
jgi:hypothetical protein